MKALATLTILFFLSTTDAAIAAELHGMQSSDRIPGSYIVVLKNREHAFSTAQDMGRVHRGRVTHTYARALNGFAIEASEAVVAALARDPRVAFIEADRIVRIGAVQSPATWGLDRIDQRDPPLDDRYTFNTTAAAVNVYILDTGIDLAHGEFGGRASSAFTAINDGRGSDDCNGHGTHVAGTVAGSTYGIAKQARVHAVRVLGCNGSGALSGVIAGIDWVTANHIAPAVANMSLGGGASNALDNAVRNSIASGVSYAVAAGNSNADACNGSPARVDEAITVGASTAGDARASFSNFGRCVDLFAPGSGITSAWIGGNGATRTISGTSMASPHAAGVAALYLAEHPGAAPAEVAQALRASASAGRLTVLGAGSPNLLLFSLLTPEGGGTPSPPPPPTTCPTGYETHDGQLAGTGSRAFEPNGTFYFSGSGTQSGILKGSIGGNFNLQLWKWNWFFGWLVVASSSNPDSNETIDYGGSAGYYTWNVNSASGGGDYLFCLKRP